MLVELDDVLTFIYRTGANAVDWNERKALFDIGLALENKYKSMVKTNNTGEQK